MTSTPRGGSLSGAGAAVAQTPRQEVSQEVLPSSEQAVVPEALFYASDAERERVQRARKSYPIKGAKKERPAGAHELIFSAQDEEPTCPRRVIGFGVGFEKVFASTSVKLPVSAYTLFTELHITGTDQVYSRCFNGLNTVFDLKKWIYEKMLVPMNAYELSYAEPGKAQLTDHLRLLTTQESLDARTLAATRAVHRMYKGIPGVHSIDDLGVTRLYARLKCRTCGDLLNSLQTCRRHKAFGPKEPPVDPEWTTELVSGGDAPIVRVSPVARPATAPSMQGIPGGDPTIEECWHAPDAAKHCLFHTRGFEMYESARAHVGHAEFARVYICRSKEPSKVLKHSTNVLSARGHMTVSY
mmetsp:Transcript_54556/g.130154  ORF Transcript_54556/g.130154 Transcript_54556/m.130154 type:complete len:355 (+) Transcript_54556:35-1099(+)